MEKKEFEFEIPSELVVHRAVEQLPGRTPTDAECWLAVSLALEALGEDRRKQLALIKGFKEETNAKLNAIQGSIEQLLKISATHSHKSIQRLAEKVQTLEQQTNPGKETKAGPKEEPESDQSSSLEDSFLQSE